MSDKTIKAIKAYLYNTGQPTASTVDNAQYLEMTNGKKAKRVLDKQRTNQRYYQTETIHQPLLDHYENVDWWERDTDHDMSAYMERR